MSVSEFEKIGKYEVIDKIGQGSFGVVYRGRDPYLKRDVAIKICSVEDEDLRRRFFREAEISGKLQHRNVVTVFDFGLEGAIPFLVQEYLSGEDLDAVIKRREVLPATTKLGYLIQVAQGLACAHELGIIHRDVKPGNVRLLENGQVKIMDFGIAKLASAETQLTQKGVTMGTASYLPPEQVRGGDLDHRADIFSLGVLAYELLTYERPFGGNTLSALVYQILYKVPTPMSGVWQECPEELSDVVARCLEKKPEHRYDNCTQVAAAFEAVCQGIATGRWPALQGASPPRAGAPRETGTGEVMSQTMVSSTARELAQARGDQTRATGERSAAPPAMPKRDLESTQPVAVVPAPAAAPSAPAAPAAPPSAARTQSIPTVKLSLPADPVLASRAHEIGNLIAQGDLNQAMHELEATLSRQKAAPPTPPLAASPAVPIAAIPAPKKGKAVDSIEITRPIPISPSIEPHHVVMEPPPPLPSLSGQMPVLGSPAVAPPAVAPLVASAATKGEKPSSGALKGVLIAVLALGLVGAGLATLAWWFFGRSSPPPPAPVVEVAPPPQEVAAPVSGFVAINAVPWAEVREITNAEGFVQELPAVRATPLYLALPPGSYTISLTNPDHPEIQECEVVVSADLATACDVTFETPDVTLYFKESGWWK